MLTINFSDIFKSSFLETVSSFSLIDAIIAIGVSFAVGLFIFEIYKKTFKGVIYSQSFNASLVVMTMVTALVIQGITSNIVLSLGMVGALSIVRFRAAIKDPLDIFYLFWSIAVGILCGAGLIPLAVIGSLMIGFIIVVLMNKLSIDVPYLLIVKCSDDDAEKSVTNLLKNEMKKFGIKSKTVTGSDGIEIVYEIRLKTETTSFVNQISKLNGVFSAVMVSYDGNYGA